jgi:hypothetical protein
LQQQQQQQQQAGVRCAATAGAALLRAERVAYVDASVSGENTLLLLGAQQ